MGDDLSALELEMAAAARLAGARRKVAIAWVRSADRDLSALDRPTWGGPVDAWHLAVDALAESAETCEAYERFGGYTGR